MTRIVSFWLLVAIIVAVSLVFYQVMAGFLLPLFLATLLVVIFQPVHRRILRQCGTHRPLLSATLATAAVLACVFLPAIWIISAAASQSLALIRQIDLNTTLRQLQNVRVSLDLDVPQFEEAAELVPLFRDLQAAAREPGDDGEDPSRRDPARVDSARVDPARVDPARVDPARVDPARVDPARVDPAVAEGLARRFDAVGERLETLFAGFPAEEADWPRPEIQPVQERLEKVRYALRAGAQSARRPVSRFPATPEPPATPAPASANESSESNTPAVHGETNAKPPSATETKESDASDPPPRITAAGQAERAGKGGLTNQDAAHSAKTSGSDTPPGPETKEPTSTPPVETDTFESPAVVRAADEAAEAYAELRLSLPRGLPRLWLRQAANPTPAQLRQWRDNAQGAVQSWLLPAANATAGFVVQVVFGGLIMIVGVFFFFADGERMTVNVMRLIPLDIRHQQELLDDFAGITRAVVTATIVSAVAQGVLAGLGFWVSGVESVTFLVLLTIVLAMIPFVGAMSVWIPVCLWIGVVEGRMWTAVILAVYSGVVVSQVDNIIKPMILQGRSNLHPLLALLSVLGGVKALGPIGILIGPMVVVFLQTLLKILHREMTSLEGSARRTVAAADPPA